MGTVFNRGDQGQPELVRRVSGDGRWVYKASRQPTKALSKPWIQEIESRIARGQAGIEDNDEAPMFKPLFDAFLDGLTNRNAADDRSRARRHLLPHFMRKKVADIDLGAVMEWIDEQRAAGELGEASIRHNMNLLSRFFSWAIARGKASINPVRLIPMGSRPTQSVKSDTPWLDDDAIVRKLINDLKEPISFLFYLCNRSGLRTGEAAGLRMSDMAFVEEGIIRVSLLVRQPAQRGQEGRRQGEVGAGAGRLPSSSARGSNNAKRKAQVRRIACSRTRVAKGSATARSSSRRAGRKRRRSTSADAMPCSRKTKGKVVTELKPKMTWYQATRHSFVSRHLSRGASLDEVSAAVGHSSPIVTKRFYDHYVRRSFSPRLRAGLGLTAKQTNGRVVPLKRSAR